MFNYFTKLIQNLVNCYNWQSTFDSVLQIAIDRSIDEAYNQWRRSPVSKRFFCLMAPRNYRVWWSIAGLLVFGKVYVVASRIVSDEIQLIRKIRHNRLRRTENRVKEAAKLFSRNFDAPHSFSLPFQTIMLRKM